MIILGINAYHGDSSAALLQDGRLVAAVEEERFRRIKHWAGFPSQSIQYCLSEGGVNIRDVDHIALSFDPRANLGKKALFSLMHVRSVSFLYDRLRRQSKTGALKDLLAQVCACGPADIRAQCHCVEHHLAHMASAFFTSPFDDAAILSVDGMGDFVSTMFGHGTANHMGVLSRIYYPHSLGYLYEATTHFLGFHHYGDEYKVMGLAPYGEPVYLDTFRKIIYGTKGGLELNLDYFTHHTKGMSIAWDGGAPSSEPFHGPLLEQELGPMVHESGVIGAREENIAASLQRVTEEILFRLLTALYERYPSPNLCLAGGVAMNSVANGKIPKMTPFKNLFIPAGAADNGTSFGAAFYVWNQLLRQPRRFVLKHAFWGPEYRERDYEAALASCHLRYCRLNEDDLCRNVVDSLCAGKIVSWYQGRMEFGARALGNRTLLADPRRTDVRDIINLRIKFREKFRPFAPSILADRVADYFEEPVLSPFMEKVIPIRAERRREIPAVTHVDGTGRLQTVDRDTNPLYWKLIRAFESKTGVPLVLNTSLNENEPIVCTPQEALSCFLRTRIDVMVLGPFYLERPSENDPQDASAHRCHGSGAILSGVST